MERLDREVARRRGQRKLDAMKRRTGQLRRRVVATAIVGFVLLWTVVFVQMATGNDPALGSGKATPPGATKAPLPEPQRRSLQASPPPSSEEDDEESPPAAEAETGEEAAIEAEGAAAEQAELEAAEAEQFEAEQFEAEARELEELEAVTTAQS
jgi:hypothetical protein